MTCPLCNEPAEVIADSGYVDADRVTCARCSPSGRLLMAGLVRRTLENLSGSDRALLPYLSAYTRQATDRGEEVSLDSRDWAEKARAHQGIPVTQKVIRLLQLIANRSQYPGDYATVQPKADYPIVDAAGSAEMEYLLRYLQDRGFLTTGQFVGPGGGGYPNETRYRLTVEGWRHLEPDARVGIPGRCFVAMACDASLDVAYTDGVLPAVQRDCGSTAILIEKTEHNDKICDRALAEIRLAEFVVADVTLHRQNVYFEAGFAMGLGRPVVWTCREDEFTRDKQHFDTRQYPHILWSTPADLRRKLSDRIRATILKTLDRPGP